MCGFAGVIAWDERYRVSRQTIEKMSARIAHRGPDGEGIFLSPESQITLQRPQVALAHRRLAILDPDPRANQPFTDNANRWLVFNGEIYNFRDLRKELSSLQPGYRWRTECDTEVLLLAYDQWSEKCVDHLNGMFAFAVWDAPRNSLFLGRDRMGQKPLYIAAPSRESPNRALAFASELGALAVLDWATDSIDERQIAEYLRWGYCGPTATIHSNITKLAPGMWRRFDGEADQSGYYFSPNAADSDQLHSAPETRRKIIEAVQRQLVSDVPLGCFLSGGVDSSIIVAAARMAGPVQTFSIGFEDARYDETKYARAAAAHLQTKHHEFIVRPDAAADLPKLAAVFGEPFADSSALPTHYLARETGQRVKVALSGDGGDELFGGYERYRAMRIGHQLDRLPFALRRFISRSASACLPAGHPKSLLTKAKRFLQTLDRPPSARYSGYMRIFDDVMLRELFIAPPHVGPDLIQSQFEALQVDRDVVEAALATDRCGYLPDDLLAKVDRASMLHALEVRSPFMDHDLVRFAAGLTTDQLLAGGPKRMLREAFANDLPAWVFKRKKMGFAVPIGDWLRNELRPMLHDHVFALDSFAAGHFKRPLIERMVEEHETRRADHSHRLYSLLMLELWWRGKKSV